jgi:hypothetical protein
MKQTLPSAAAPAPAAKPAAKAAPAPSSLAAAFDQLAQKSGFESWKQLDREQPLPTRTSAPPAKTDPDAKPEPPKIANKLKASGQDSADVSFSDFIKGTQPLPQVRKKRG